MKRPTRLIILTFVLTVLLCSCGEKEYLFDTEAAAAALPDVYAADKSAEILTLEEDEAALRYGIEDLYISLECGVSVTITSDEYLIAHAKDAESAKKIYEALDRYRAERIELFSSYAEEQVPKLKNAVLKCEGEYVFFAVSAEPDTAEKIWKDNLTEKQ